MSEQVKIGRRTFLKGSAAASALLALAACKKADDAPTAEAEGTGATAKVYINNPVSIDPYNCQESEGTQVCYQIFDSLTDYDYEKGELVPSAAASWKPNDGATEFTFTLVEGAKFHNGDPVDAESFKRAWTRLVDPKTNESSPSAVNYHIAMVDGYDALVAGETDELTGVTCPDEKTLVVKLAVPYADFPYVASHPALGPVPAVALEDFDTFFRAPIGNGPFMMDGKWEDGQYINVKRFEDYVGDKPSIAAVQFNIQKDMETAYKEFQAGNYDFCDVPTAQIKSAQDTYGVSEDGYTITPGKQMLLGDEASVYYLTVNNNDPVLKDPNLRKAISLAINRQAICDTVFSGTRTPAANIVPPGIAGYEDDVWEYSHYDKDAAVKLLDQYYPADADGKRNVSFQLSFNGDGNHGDIMEAIQADLAAVGIDAQLDQGEWAAILDRYQNGDYQAGRLGWIADYPIMDNYLYPLFYTGNGDNRSLYSNPAVDEALDKARQTTDDDERIAALQAVNKTISEDFPVIPIFFYKHTYVGSDKVKSAYVDPSKKIKLRAAEMEG
ncbi:peptide ABC transporter substrate-binding protein [Granulimonas faecalis]|uniref:Peptide ABC transporter substrate-binding protein n=1 Tax=Granulimonas faecalis TaxID=2894155 RepID=A0AAV5B3H4_9ACTN|nr:ABC transporter substrate-binding protein [Granulimonas faecalis]GJM55166.1 peptide ABC transporter substrate-binding protein [Granulimonas faecalis]